MKISTIMTAGAFVLAASTAGAQVSVSGSTQGCFAASPATTCASYGTTASFGHLSFAGTAEGPFTLVQGVPFSISNLGSFTVGNGTDTYTGEDFFLKFLFTSPGAGGAISEGVIAGAVHGNDGDVSITFADGTTTVAGDMFILHVNNLSHSDTDTHTLSGTLTYAGTTSTPEPSSLALIGTGLFGLVPLVRRKRA